MPVALWLLPLALLPLLALRRRPAQRLPVATLHLWLTAAARDAAPLARRVRRHWLAVLQAAIVAAIAMAVARPLWPSGTGVAAVVIDTSLSMSARSGDTTRLALAVDRAAAWAKELPRGMRVRLIATAPAAHVAGEFSSRGGELERALAALRATGAGAPLGAALAFARDASPPPARILVVTDGAPPAGETSAEWAAVGTPADNLALVSLSARRSRADANGADILAHVWNFGTRQADTTLTLSRDGALLVRRRLSIPPAAGATVTALLGDGGGVVIGRIDANDAIDGDNARTTTVAPPLALRVAIEGGAGFLAQALRTRAGVTLVPSAAEADVVVCTDCTTVSPTTPPRAGVLMAVAAASGQAAAAPLSIDSAANALPGSTALEGVEAIALDGPEPVPGTVVARAGRRPAILAYEDAGRRVVELRLDLVRSPLVLTPAFPILVTDALDWLSRRAPETAATFESDESDVSRAVPASASVGAAAAGAEAPRVPEDSVRDLSGLLLVIALGMVGVEWRLKPGGWRPVRGAAAALLALAAFGPRIPWGEAPRAIVFALDTSDSMNARRGDALRRLSRATAGMRAGDRAGLVVFGADATIERRLDDAPLGGAAPVARTLGTATNLGQALRTARAALPAESVARGGARIVLLSDGVETAGDAGVEARAARAAGVPIDVAAPGGAAGSTARPLVTRVSAPPAVHQGEPFDITATVEGAPGASATVVFEAGGTPLEQRQLLIPPSGATTAAVTVRSPQPGLSVYRARVDASELIADMSDGAAGAVVAVEGEPRLLNVSDGSAPAVAPAGYRVSSLTPQELPHTAAALAGFDAVVLDDVDAARLDAAQRRALAQHVEQGGGLFVLGSPRSLLPLDDDDPLQAALPVDLRPRRGGRAPGLALVIVFDKSGSMDDRIDGAPRIEFARQAVRRVLASLPPTDAVGVIAFDAGATEVAALRPGHDAAGLAERLNAVRPSGATAIAPALEQAVSWLSAPAASSFARRLVLLVSDGRTSSADQARARMALRPGVELSTVALGDEADRAFLDELARAAGGRAFYPRRLGELPALAAREAVRVSGGRVVEERVALQAGSHPLLAGIDGAALPVLGGYVVTVLKPGAEVALRSPLGDPILAAWRHGLGKVAIYTADLRSPWSAGLRAWPQGPALLTQSARWISRRMDHSFLHVESRERDGRLRLLVEARDSAGGFLSGLDVGAVARTPAGTTVDVVLRATGPGSYEGVVPLDDAGPYTFAITASSRDGRLDARVQRGVYWAAPLERGGDIDRARLASIAQMSGGRELDAGDDPFGGPRPRDRRDTRPLLAVAAMAAFLVHVLARRRARTPTTRAAAFPTPHRDAA
jgi:Mg-chelatase subunit ChlD